MNERVDLILEMGSSIVKSTEKVLAKLKLLSKEEGAAIFLSDSNWKDEWREMKESVVAPQITMIENLAKKLEEISSSGLAAERTEDANLLAESLRDVAKDLRVEISKIDILDQLFTKN